MVANYHRWIFEHQRQGSVESLREWVLQEAEFQIIACESVNGISRKIKGSAGKGLNKSGSFFGNGQCTDKKQCPVCKSDSHPAYRCETFKSMAISDRWEIAKKSNMCYCCLGSDHMAKTCTRRVKCGIDKCTSFHSRFLHTHKPLCDDCGTETLKVSRGVAGETKGTNMTTMSSTKTRTMISLRTIPVIIKNKSKRSSRRCKQPKLHQ